MTRDSAAPRWIKRYKGRRFQSTCVGHTREGHNQAWKQFEKWRSEIDQKTVEKPTAASIFDQQRIATDRLIRQLAIHFPGLTQLVRKDSADRKISQLIEEYLAYQRARACSAEITPARFGVIKSHMKSFGSQFGHLEVTAVSETELSQFHASLLASIASDEKARRLSKRTASDRLKEAKYFLLWLEAVSKQA